jgi:FkbM family methyltransferase
MDQTVVSRLFFQAASIAPGWFSECDALLAEVKQSDLENFFQEHYTEAPEARDGFSRLATYVRFRNGNLKEALRLFAGDAESGRQSREQWEQYVGCMADLGDLEAADGLIRKAYDANPALQDGFAIIGGALRPKNRGAAYAYFDLDISLGRISPAWRLRFAHLLAQMGNWDDAHQHVRTAYDEDPSLLDGHSHIGQAYYTALSDRDRVLDCFIRDRGLGRISPRARLDLARMLSVFGRMDEAREEIELAYSLDHGLRDGFLTIAKLYGISKGDARFGLNWTQLDYERGRLSATGLAVLAAIYAAIGEDETSLDLLRESVNQVTDQSNCQAAYRDTLDKLRFPKLNLNLAKIPAVISNTKPNAENVRSLVLLQDALKCRASINAELLDANARYRFDVAGQWEALLAGQGRAETEMVFDILGARLRIPNTRDALVQFLEIILQECYYFRGPARPHIIDAGTNMGMSLAYFKWLYPAAKIVAFEPNPRMFECCAESIRLNGWGDVELLPYAVTGSGGPVHLWDDLVSPMGSRILPSGQNDEASISVPSCALSGYLRERVDFLKLDIEGCEFKVMEEAETRLDNVEQGFIEYHYDSTTGGNPLGGMLSHLEAHGFHYIVQQQPEVMLRPLVRRPATRVGNSWSGNVFFNKAK